jgi:hypothetical protein
MKKTISAISNGLNYLLSDKGFNAVPGLILRYLYDKLKINWKIVLYPFILVVLLIPIYIFSLNDLSIGIYNIHFYGLDYKDPNLIFGQPRAIRSDEYIVATPWAIAQYQAKFSDNNLLFGDGLNLTLSQAPVKNWTIIFKPHFWAFFVLPLEKAYSFYWWFRSFLLLLALYLCALFVTKGNVPASVLVSLAFFFSPFIQWWYSTMMIEMTSYGLLTIYGFIRIIRSKSLLYLLGWSSFCFYFGFAFCVLLYPPFQVSIGLFLLFIGGGYLWKVWPKLSLSRRKFIVSAILSIGCLWGIFFLLYYQSFRDIINITSNTIYPGSRRVVGGGLSPLLFFSGPYNIQLLNDVVTYPPFIANQSEGSSFFFISFLCLPFLCYHTFRSWKNRERNAIIPLAGILFLLLIICWIFIGIPPIIAKFILFDFIPAKRMLYVLGIINIFFITYSLYNFPPIRNDKIALGFAAIVYGGYLQLGYALKILPTPLIQNPWKIQLISAIMGVLIYFYLKQKRMLFLGSFFLFSFVSTYRVNPIYQGLSPIINSPLSSSIKDIVQKDKSRWVVYDSLAFENYPQANGAKALTGVYSYPDLSLWKYLDPENKYSQVYNRYAHVTFIEPKSSDINAVEFELLTADHFNVLINPCNPKMVDLNVNYFIFLKPVSYPCLTAIMKIPVSNQIYIYQRSSQEDLIYSSISIKPDQNFLENGIKDVKFQDGKLIIYSGPFDPNIQNFLDLSKVKPNVDLNIRLRYNSDTTGQLAIYYSFDNQQFSDKNLVTVIIDRNSEVDGKLVEIPVVPFGGSHLTGIRFDPPDNSIFSIIKIEIGERELKK